MTWHSISLNDLPKLGESTELVMHGRIIALFNVEGDYFALDGICPHQGGPLGQGAIHGCVVSCPWHGWEYDVHDGQHQSISSLKHISLPIRISDNEVQIELTDD